MRRLQKYTLRDKRQDAEENREIFVHYGLDS